MRQRSRHFLSLMLLSAGLFIGSVFMPKSSYAIVAFAQKYHFNCTVCHTVMPNLNPFGRAFWRNGFRLPSTTGTPADATQIAEGLSVPNPWPIPIMVYGVVSYQHKTNENTPNTSEKGQANGATDAFTISHIGINIGGSYKLYSPLTDSIGFDLDFGFRQPAFMYLHFGQAVADLMDLGIGFGVPARLINLKLGNLATAGPYFYKQAPFQYPGTLANPNGGMFGQKLNVGYDGEGGALIDSQNGGFALFGTPGYHLWYKVAVTNDAGSKLATSAPENTVNAASNAMEYSYQLKEYMPVSVGQLEFGYYGATVSEPIYTAAATSSWTNRITVNGVDVDLANGIYELGLNYMVQSDSNPYANYTAFTGKLTNGTSVSGTSNGYSTFEAYGRYLFPQIGQGLMLAADYTQFSWTHEDLQEAFQNKVGGYSSSCPVDAGLYQLGTYTENGCTNQGIKDALSLVAEYNLAQNVHLYAGYVFTNVQEDNNFGAGLVFAF